MTIQILDSNEAASAASSSQTHQTNEYDGAVQIFVEILVSDNGIADVLQCGCISGFHQCALREVVGASC